MAAPPVSDFPPIYAAEIQPQKKCVRCGLMFRDRENAFGTCRWHTTPACVKEYLRLSNYPKACKVLLESKSCIYSAYYPLLYTGMDNAGDDKYPVHKCCGRMSGSPGCWVGVHSAKNPLPDLMDLTEGTLTGTAWNPNHLTSTATMESIKTMLKNRDSVAATKAISTFNRALSASRDETIPGGKWVWGAYPVQLINDNDATGGRIALSKLPECAQGKPGPATDIAIDADILSNRLAISDASEAIASAASLATGPDVPVMLTQSTYSPPQISFPPPSVEEEDAMDTILVSVNKGMDMLLLTMSELSATTDPTLKEMYAEFSDMANIVKARFRESWREYAEDDRIPDSIRSDLFLATYPNLAPYVVGDFLFSAILEDELGKKFRKIRVHDYVEDPMPLPEFIKYWDAWWAEYLKNREDRPETAVKIPKLELTINASCPQLLYRVKNIARQAAFKMKMTPPEANSFTTHRPQSVFADAEACVEWIRQNLKGAFGLMAVGTEEAVKYVTNISMVYRLSPKLETLHAPNGIEPSLVLGSFLPRKLAFERDRDEFLMRRSGVMTEIIKATSLFLQESGIPVLLKFRQVVQQIGDVKVRSAATIAELNRQAREINAETENLRRTCISPGMPRYGIDVPEKPGLIPRSRAPSAAAPPSPASPSNPPPPIAAH